jgi:hypothetical protein
VSFCTTASVFVTHSAIPTTVHTPNESQITERHCSRKLPQFTNRNTPNPLPNPSIFTNPQNHDLLHSTTQAFLMQEFNWLFSATHFFKRIEMTLFTTIQFRTGCTSKFYQLNLPLNNIVNLQVAIK